MRRIASRIVYRNAWMTVREDDVERLDGSVGIYGVVEKPDFAVIIPEEDGGFWLVEQHRYPVGRRAWELPQGSWSPGDDGGLRSNVELARAELAEETGLRAGRISHLGHLYAAYGFSTQGFDVFLARELERGEPRREVTEHDMEQQLVERAAVDAMIRRGEIVDSATVAAFALLDLHGSASR